MASTYLKLFIGFSGFEAIVHAGFWGLPGVPPTSGQKKPPKRLFLSSKHAFLEACQKWISEPFRCPEGLARTSTPQYVGLEGLGRKNTTKCVGLEAFGHKRTTKYVGLEGWGRKSTTKYIGLEGLGRKHATKYIGL